MIKEILSGQKKLDSVSLNGVADKEVKVTGIDYCGVFEFLHLFKGFRLAINPAKIVIALIALLLIYLSGICFDVIWGPQVYDQEIENYQNFSRDGYRQLRIRRLESRQQDLASALSIAGSNSESHLSFREAEELSHNPRGAFRALKNAYQAEFRTALDTAARDRVSEESLRAKGYGLSSQTPAEQENQARTRAAMALQGHLSSAKQIVGRGIIEAFLAYEERQLDALVDNTFAPVRVESIHSTGSSNSDLDILEDHSISMGLISRNSGRLFRSDNIAGCIVNLVYTGPAWLITGTAPAQWSPESDDASSAINKTGKLVAYRGIYWVSIIILLAFWLAVLTLAGGMISRLSALEFAGYDKAGLKGIFLFVKTRFWTFFKAPLMPLGILLILGVAIIVLSLLGAIPFLGEIVLGIVFIVLLALGFIMMLLTLGILGGINLLYPTIAVEGSDNFDAMSRGFAYVYARPWRLIAYSLVSLFYGVLTFVFVSLVVYLILALTHLFANFGTSLFGYNHAWLAGSLKLDALWPSPKFNNLFHDVNWAALSWTEWIGAGLIQSWLWLLMAALGGYVISYYFSANTIIYYLLRRSVDGQGLANVLPPEDLIPPSTPAEAVDQVSPTVST